MDLDQDLIENDLYFDDFEDDKPPTTTTTKASYHDPPAVVAPKDPSPGPSIVATAAGEDTVYSDNFDKVSISSSSTISNNNNNNNKGSSTKVPSRPESYQELQPPPAPSLSFPAPSIIPKAPEARSGSALKQEDKDTALLPSHRRAPSNKSDSGSGSGSGGSGGYIPSFLTRGKNKPVTASQSSASSRSQSQASQATDPAPPSKSFSTSIPQPAPAPSQPPPPLSPPAPAVEGIASPGFPSYSSTSSCSLIPAQSPVKELQPSPPPPIKDDPSPLSKPLFPKSIPDNKPSTGPSKPTTSTTGTKTLPAPSTTTTTTSTTTKATVAPNSKPLFSTSDLKPLFPSAPVPQWRIHANAVVESAPKEKSQSPRPKKDLSKAYQGLPKKDMASDNKAGPTTVHHEKRRPVPPQAAAAPMKAIVTTTSATRERDPRPTNAHSTKATTAAAAATTTTATVSGHNTSHNKASKGHEVTVCVPTVKPERRPVKEPVPQPPITIYVPPREQIVASPLKAPSRRSNKRPYAGSPPPCAVNVGPNTHVYFGLGKEMDDPDFDELEELENANRELKAELEGYKQALRKSLHNQGPPVQSVISRMQLNKFSSPSVLEKQLNSAQQKIDMYRKTNNMLKEKVARLSDNDLLEKLEQKVRVKEERIQELQEESRALHSLRRNFEKQLMKEREVREHWPETINSLQKDIRVYQFKLRRLKVFIESLRKKEREQVEQIESLTVHNKELMERLAVSMKLGPDVPLDDPTKLLRKANKGQEKAAKEQAINDERKKLEKEVEQLQRFLKQNKRSAESELKTIKRDLEEAREEKTRLDAILEAKEKEERLQHLQAKIMKRTLRDLIGGHMEVRDAKAVLSTLRQDSGDELAALVGVKGSRPLPRSPHRRRSPKSGAGGPMAPHPPKDGAGHRETPLASRRMYAEGEPPPLGTMDDEDEDDDDEQERQLLAIAFNLHTPTETPSREDLIRQAKTPLLDSGPESIEMELEHDEEEAPLPQDEGQHQPQKEQEEKQEDRGRVSSDDEPQAVERSADLTEVPSDPHRSTIPLQNQGEDIDPLKPLIEGGEGGEQEERKEPEGKEAIEELRDNDAAFAEAVATFSEEAPPSVPLSQAGPTAASPHEDEYDVDFED